MKAPSSGNKNPSANSRHLRHLFSAKGPQGGAKSNLERQREEARTENTAAINVPAFFFLLRARK
jgi:hypothetical protein